MKKRDPWIALLVLGSVVAAGGTWSCKPESELSDEDRQARIDDQGQEPDEIPEEDKLFPNTDVGRLLEEHLLALALPAEYPEEADERVAESLAGLRQNRAEAVELLSAAYREIAEERYYDRWALAKTLADLEAPEAYETVSSIARAPLPPERYEDTHHFSTQEEEIMIRLRAVDGLAALAAQGHEAADEDLLALATEEGYASPAVRLRAIKAFLRSRGDREARTKLLLGRLPKELHEQVTLEVTPQEDFQKRVSELASISEETTNDDGAEERLPDEEAPAATTEEGGERDETGQ